jgi:Rrf2 family protein
VLSSKAKYGLKALTYLAAHDGAGPVLISEIATRQAIPRKFLDTILLELKQQGILSSKKGKGGGYQLARPAKAIMIGPVVRILDGPLAPIACVSRTAYRRCEDCPDERACGVHSLMQDVRDGIAAILDNTSLADLEARSRPGRTAATPG